VHQQYVTIHAPTCKNDACRKWRALLCQSAKVKVKNWRRWIYVALYNAAPDLESAEIWPVCNKGITQFYLPPRREPYLPLLASRKASPPFVRYQLILRGEQRHMGVRNLPRVLRPRVEPTTSWSQVRHYWQRYDPYVCVYVSVLFLYFCTWMLALKVKGKSFTSIRSLSLDWILLLKTDKSQCGIRA